MTSPKNSPKHLLLVDGHYYLYRSFFAIRGLTNSKGEPTNAIYGFVKALRRMLADLKPVYAPLSGMQDCRSAARRSSPITNSTATRCPTIWRFSRSRFRRSCR